MVDLTFGHSISATIKIRNVTYTLVGDVTLEASTSGGGGGGSGGGSAPAKVPAVRLVYQAPFDEAPSLGTLASTVTGVGDLVKEISDVLKVPALESEWKRAGDGVRARFELLPNPLGRILTDVFERVELKITEIGLELTPNEARTSYERGVVALGFGFDCSSVDDPTLLGIKLTAIGVRVGVGVTSP